MVAMGVLRIVSVGISKLVVAVTPTTVNLLEVLCSYNFVVSLAATNHIDSHTLLLPWEPRKKNILGNEDCGSYVVWVKVFT
jgi:flagellar biogenesis protein FliO